MSKTEFVEEIEDIEFKECFNFTLKIVTGEEFNLFTVVTGETFNQFKEFKKNLIFLEIKETKKDPQKENNKTIKINEKDPQRVVL
jgi:hypothetical protein